MVRIPHVDEAMLEAEYWIKHQGLTDQRLFTDEDRKRWHDQWSREVPTCVDLSTFPEQLTNHQIASWIADDDHFSDVYYDLNNQPLEPTFWRKVRENCNKPEIGVTICAYAFTICRTAMRTLPTVVSAFKEGQAPRFDRLQETAIHMFEPVIILHRSRDGLFAYVQAQNYRGWVQNAHLARTDRDTFSRHLKETSWVYVIGTNVEAVSSDRSVPIEYAGRLPLIATQSENLLVALPGQAQDGTYVAGQGRLERGAGVSVGALPCTRPNILRQAFRLLGEPYGWGDEYGLHDCSSFVMDVYRTIGLNLPRNAGEQEYLPGAGVAKTVYLRAWTASERYAALSHCQPGDLIYMPGHTMIYLGEIGDRRYVIHDFSGYAQLTEDGTLHAVSVLQVGVSPLELYLMSGATYLEALTTTLSFHTTVARS
ncbi:MAG: SH3 domain-containing protein [Firmicutes bacterium]|nr:SH3 domain-containing protein [Bacillota bacterium]